MIRYTFGLDVISYKLGLTFENQHFNLLHVHC